MLSHHVQIYSKQKYVLLNRKKNVRKNISTCTTGFKVTYIWISIFKRMLPLVYDLAAICVPVYWGFFFVSLNILSIFFFFFAQWSINKIRNQKIMAHLMCGREGRENIWEPEINYLIKVKYSGLSIISLSHYNFFL